MHKNVFAYALIVVFLALSYIPAYAMPPTPQTLQGAWAGTNGKDTLMLMFMGNACAMAMNGQQIAGVWNISGNRLSMQFQNGRSLSYSADVQGTMLILDGDIRLTRQSMPNQQPQGGTWGGSGAGTWGGSGAGTWGGPSQPAFGQSPLEGMWSVMIPQGKRSFRFSGNRYAQLLNGQVVEEGIFTLHPDGRFLYQVTQGQYQGQQGEDRITINGNSITVAWPDGTVLTFVRDTMDSSFGGTMPNASPNVSPNATPLEGRWIWAKQGPNSFGYVFSGNQFVFYWNGVERSRGIFSFSGVQLTMQHQTGPDAGKTDVLGCQLQGNRLLIFTSQDPNVAPIPFVRQ